MKVEAEIGMMCPQAKGHHRFPGAIRSYEKSMEQILPLSRQKESTLISDFWTPELWNNKSLFFQGTRFVGDSHGSHRKAIQLLSRNCMLWFIPLFCPWIYSKSHGVFLLVFENGWLLVRGRNGHERRQQCQSSRGSFFFASYTLVFSNQLILAGFYYLNTSNSLDCGCLPLHSHLLSSCTWASSNIFSTKVFVLCNTT